MQDLLDLEEQKIIDSLAIDLQTLQTAMEDFGLDNMLGQGDFGPVYKVWRFDVASSFSLCLYFLCHIEVHVSIFRGGSSMGEGGSSPLSQELHGRRKKGVAFMNRCEVLAFYLRLFVLADRCGETRSTGSFYGHLWNFSRSAIPP